MIEIHFHWPKADERVDVIMAFAKVFSNAITALIDTAPGNDHAEISFSLYRANNAMIEVIEPRLKVIAKYSGNQVSMKMYRKVEDILKSTEA